MRWFPGSYFLPLLNGNGRWRPYPSCKTSPNLITNQEELRRDYWPKSLENGMNGSIFQGDSFTTRSNPLKGNPVLFFYADIGDIGRDLIERIP
jgi:hypothetical protein